METMHTERLVLRELSIGDLADFHECASHPDVGPNAGWKPLSSLEEARRVLREFIEKKETWAIVERQSGKVVGTVALHPDKLRNHDRAREIGYALNPVCWGKGYSTEAVKAVIRHGFEHMELLVLSGVHYPFNERSKSVLTKCGFKYEGTLRLCHEVYTGEIYDHVCYSITRGEYEKQTN